MNLFKVNSKNSEMISVDLVHIPRNIQCINLVSLLIKDLWEDIYLLDNLNFYLS